MGRVFKIGILFSILAVSVFAARVAFGSSVTPIPVLGNPDCSALAEEFGGGETWLELRIDGKDLAETDYTSDDGYLTVTIDNLVISGDDKISFDWTSDNGVDAVFVKGGNVDGPGTPGGNLYLYDPESTGDDGLHTPQNTNISHVLFCYDIEETTSTTAAGGTTSTTAGGATTTAAPTVPTAPPAKAVKGAAPFTG